MQKHYKQGSPLNQEIVEGVNILADNVSATLGPRGRTVALFLKEQGVPVLTKDGVTIADFVELDGPFQTLEHRSSSKRQNKRWRLPETEPQHPQFSQEQS